MASKYHKKEKRKNRKYLFEEVIEILKDFGSKPLNYKQICSRIGVSDHGQKLLVQSILKDLTEKGLAEELDRGKFRWKQASRTFTGNLELISSGAAYFIPLEGEEGDVYIPAGKLKGALNGDLVRIKAYRRGGKKREGEVVEIIRRARTEVVGSLYNSGKNWFLIPDNSRFGSDIFIPNDLIGKATEKDKAVVRIREYPEGKNPVGEVVRVLGRAGEMDTEIHAILEEFGLPYTFPEEVIRESEKIPVQIPEQEIQRRRDFRNITTFTIDPFDAKDFDDALSIRRLPGNNWEVGVHIADVTHYLREGTLLDKEAYARATSVYLVDRTVPMLPEVLSNELCSLKPNEDKLCFSAVFELDEEANVKNEWFGRTVIHSVRRFNYEEAQSVLESGKGDFADELQTLDRLAKKLRKERFRKGSIGFEKLEVKFKLDEKGNPLGVFFKHMKDSNQLIEDFMLLANKRVAMFMGKHGGSHGAPRPFVYRIHDSPDPEKTRMFSEFASRFGYKINVKNDRTIAESLNKLMKDVRDKPEANAIELLAIRTMAKAIYSTSNIGHYGLGFEHYTHFTSPIRRYPDVMVHRLLQKKLSKDEQHGSTTLTTGPGESELEGKCKHSSEREKVASDAERSSIKYMQVKFMKDKVGQEFEGVVSGVTEFGIFVELTDSLCEGMVRLRDITSDIFYYDEEHYRIVGRRTKRTITLGDKVMIEVKKADLPRKQLEFMLLEEQREKGKARGKEEKGKKDFRNAIVQEKGEQKQEEMQGSKKRGKSVRDEWGFEV